MQIVVRERRIGYILSCIKFLFSNEVGAMVRRVTPSQMRSILRQQQQKRQRAVDDYNRKVRTHNQKVKQAVTSLNRAVDAHNREVRAHNNRVRSNQQRLKSEIARLQRQTNTTRFVTLRTSVNTVQRAYSRLESAEESGGYDDRYNEFLDLSEREAANSAALMNSLLDEGDTADTPVSLESPVTPILAAISDEFANRWRGALFSLNPNNPAAARHFCTSAREIIARLLDAKADNRDVIAAIPDCELNQRGTPTRRAKIGYLLHLKQMRNEQIETFVDADVEDVILLFQTFNEGTHGEAGKFGLSQLNAIRKRVEDSVMFLARIADL